MSKNENSPRKPDAGYLYHIFLESEYNKIIKNIQNIENLKDETDVIIFLIQNYAKKNIKQQDLIEHKISQSPNSYIKNLSSIDTFDKLGFNGNIELEKLEKILSSVEYTNSIKKLPQHEIYNISSAGLIHGFQNKILPVKFNLMCLSKMIVENDSPWISLNEFKKYTLKSVEIFLERYNYSPIYNKFKVNTGFPSKKISHKDFDDSYESFKRSSKRFVEEFVGRKLQKHEGVQIGGACFEMGLIDAKTLSYDMEENSKDFNNKKNREVYVTLSEIGKEFVLYKNDLIDYIYNYNKIKPETIFSKQERAFYFKKILSQFKFENNFVEHLMKYDKIRHTREIQIWFKERFLKFCDSEFPEVIVRLSNSHVRIYSNTIMNRLIEFGVFVKDPKLKSGPYTRMYSLSDLLKNV